MKIAAPGIPDIYQGMELWDFSLVDPDNRRPVDYELRMSMLDEMKREIDCAGPDRRKLVGQLLDQKTDGRIKFYVTMIGLQYRRAHPLVFAEGRYVALEGQGPRSQHVCAFARVHEEKTIVAVVPRLLGGLMSETKGAAPLGADVWQDTCLLLPDDEPGIEYRNLFTSHIIRPDRHDGRSTLQLQHILQDCPVALLERLVHGVDRS